MGRKLTSWERAQRERERERERQRKANEVKRRRAAAKAEKEAQIRKNTANAEKSVKQYEKFYQSITCLHLHKIGGKKFLSSLDDRLNSDDIIKKPVNPGLFKFSEKKKLKTLKNQSQYNFSEYCKSESKSTFFLFVMLFGTEQKHKLYIEKRKKEYEELKRLEEKRKVNEEEAHNDSILEYQSNMEKYNLKLSEFQSKSKKWIDGLSNADIAIIEEATELMFPIEFSFDKDHEMSNPTDSDVGYKIISSDSIEICINLPSDLNFLPEKGLKMTPSGKSASEFKISKKLITEAANRVTCSIAFSYIEAVFSVLTNIKNINIEVGIAGTDPKTGNAADLIFLSMKVNKTEYSKINISKVDVLNAVENFDHKYRSSDSKKNLKGEINREELIWATEDDKNIKIDKLIQKTFRECFYS